MLSDGGSEQREVGQWYGGSEMTDRGRGREIGQGSVAMSVDDEG